MDNVGVVITVRESSDRVKNKALAMIDHRRAIEVLLDNLEGFDVCLAVPEGDGDTLLEIVKSRDVRCIWGMNDSPLHRLHLAADLHCYDHVVRITADDILIDPYLLRKQIEYHIKNELDYTYMGRCPFGSAGEVISFAALQKVAFAHKEPVEFVSYYLKGHGFKFKEFYPPIEYQKILYVALDTPDDLKLLRAIFSILPTGFGTLDLINLYKRSPQLFEINKPPVVTVYTCNFNFAGYIAETIDSVMAQDVDFEYIILDDGSTDDSCAMILSTLAKYPSHMRDRVKVIRNTYNMGLSESSNKCLNSARGRYVMRVDSDDSIAPGLIAKFISTISKEKTAGCLSGFYRDGKSKIERHYHTGCGLFKTRIVQEYRYQNSLSFAKGTEFLERMTDNKKLSFIPEALWNYRKHERSATALKGDTT